MTSAPTRARRWLERLNGSKHMLWLLAALSFLETIIPNFSQDAVAE